MIKDEQGTIVDQELNITFEEYDSETGLYMLCFSTNTRSDGVGGRAFFVSQCTVVYAPGACETLSVAFWWSAEGPFQRIWYKM